MAERKPTPEARAWLPSRLLFTWATPIFSRALRYSTQAKGLAHDDLWLLDEHDRAAWAARQFDEGWRAAEANIRAEAGLADTEPLSEKQCNRAFNAAAWRVLGRRFFYGAAAIRWTNSTLQFLFPIIISGVITSMQGRSPYGRLPATTATGFALVGALGVAVMGKAVVEPAYFFVVERAGWRLRSAVMTAVFSKSLRLSAAARQQRTLGEMVNIMQIDATKLEMFLMQFHVLWDGLYQIAGYLTILFFLIGWSTLLGLVVMIVSMPIGLNVNKRQQRLSGLVAKVTDKRIKVINEAMQSALAVKMYSWEGHFTKAVTSHRTNEMRLRNAMIHLKAFSIAYMMATPVIVSIVAFSAYAAAANGTIDAAILFAAVSAFGQLRFPLMFYPMALMNYAQAKVSRQRIGSLIAMSETKHAAARALLAPGAAPPSPAYTKPAGWLSDREEPRIKVEGGDFWWVEPAEAQAQAQPPVSPTPVTLVKKSQMEGGNAAAPAATDAKGSGIAVAPTDAASKTATGGTTEAASNGAAAGDGSGADAEGAQVVRPILSDVSLEVRTGELLGIVGGTGVGKSSLVSALLGEMVQTAGAPVMRNGSVAYAAQTSWVLNATLRDNVLFGEPYDEGRFRRVLSACQLDADLKNLPHGETTEIGERGITLSGGQKARVALARAAYARRDVVVLDDVLAALDPEVASAVFDECVLGLMGESTRLFVTNRLDLLPACDRAVLLAKPGGTGSAARIVEEGTYDELVAAKGALAGLLDAYNATDHAAAPADEGALGSFGAAIMGTSPSASPKMTAADEEAYKGLGAAEVRRRRLANRTLLPAPQAAPPAVEVAGEATSTAAALPKTMEAAPEKPKGDGQLMTEEEKAQGAVKLSVFGRYVREMGGPCVALLVSLLFTTSTGCMLGSSIWIGLWTADATPSAMAVNGTAVAVPPYRSFSKDFYLGGYAGLGLLLALVTFVRSVVLTRASILASTRLHASLTARVMRAPMSFFDTTPIGRIVSRFSKDIFTIDEEINMFLDMFLMSLFFVVATLVSILAVLPWFLVAVVPVVLIYFHVVRYYRIISRETKRLESVARSPVYAHYSETLGGIPTIRAYGASSRFVAHNHALIDTLNEAYYLNKVSDRWLSVRFELLGSSITFATALLAMIAATVGREGDGPVSSVFIGMAGFVISNTTMMTALLSALMRSFGQLEAAMTCVERVLHYIGTVPQEAAEHSPSPPPAEWPPHGTIELRNLRMRYRPETPLVLRGLDATIKGGQRVGIVGRTGSGKSSLLLALMRLVEAEPTEPDAPPPISIDGLDLRDVGLSELRRKVAIIPQNPTLFSGTIRSNVDRFDEYTDEQVWQALRQCEMHEAVIEMAGEKGASGGVPSAELGMAALQSAVSEGGENLSHGQRQLLCLGRAVLQQAKILILDEATSAVDYATDALIQKTIRTAFASSTLLVIAHRIDTIIDSDQILVLSDGKIIEAGAPDVLLADKTSQFSAIRAETKAEQSN